MRDVCEAVDQEIRRLGGEPAFPTQSSRNEVAAHYCSSPDDETLYAPGDLAKLDIGVHVDGWPVDTATTVNVGDHPANRVLVEAAEAALQAAIRVARPGLAIALVSAAIARELSARGLRPMQNLCGHGLARFLVHSPPAIPNSVDGSAGRLEPGMLLAFEPFATAGSGEVVESGPAEVFRMPPERAVDGGDLDPEVLAAIRGFQGLPFARRQLSLLPRARVEATLRGLWEKGRLAAYPPLKEAGGQAVAQAEHSLYIGADGVEVLTR